MKCKLHNFMIFMVTVAVVFGVENDRPNNAEPSPFGKADIPQETLDQLQKEEDKVKEQKIGILKNAIKAKDRNIKFYGKVIDFDGQPVEDAIVTIYLRYFDPLNAFLMGEKMYDVKSDRDGIFEFNKKGQYLSVQGIKKEGYEYQRNYCEYDSFDYDTKEMNGQDIASFDPESIKPIIFKVRKRGPVEYLVERKFEARFYLNEEKRPSQFDKPPYKVRILEDWLDSDGFERGKNNAFGASHEIIYPETFDVQCQFNEDGSQFDLSFRYLGTDGGLIVTDEIGYLAPETGYQRQVHIQGKTSKGTDEQGNAVELRGEKKYLYVKDRLEGVDVYARIELSITTYMRGSAERNILIKGDIFTNPSGGRSLEYDPEFNSKNKKRRTSIHDRRYKEYWNAKLERKEFDEKAFIQKIREEEKQEKLKQQDQ